MINYNIKGTEVAVTPELRSYIEKRLSHAEKFLHDTGAAHLDVELKFSEVRDGGKYGAEFTLQYKGDLFRSSEWGGSMHEAIDVAVAELNNELRQFKTKRLQLFRRSASRAKDFLRGLRDRL